MDLNKLQNHVDTRFDKLEDKIDNHMDRLARIETDVEHMKGHAKILITGVLSAVGAVLAGLIRKLFY